MKIAIIGTGLIGAERIEAIRYISERTQGAAIISSVYDADVGCRERIAAKYGVRAVGSDDAIFSDKNDWIFICTPHDVAVPTAIKALQSGAHVLIEKPLGRNLSECDSILAHKSEKQKLQVGFNYPFYAGIESAIKDANDGKFGRLISVNMVLGHGHAPGTEKTWKLDPVRCGGGCLIDPGVHLLNLALLLAKGKLEVTGGKTLAGFWNTGIEEEAHFLLSDSTDVLFNIQVSITRWRSTFRLEINGAEGYGIVEGRGRSYGPQSYRTGKRWGWHESGKPQGESEVWEITGDKADDSFIKETAVLLDRGIAEKILPAIPSASACDAKSGRATMELLEQCRRMLA